MSIPDFTPQQPRQARRELRRRRTLFRSLSVVLAIGGTGVLAGAHQAFEIRRAAADMLVPARANLDTIQQLRVGKRAELSRVQSLLQAAADHPTGANWGQLMAYIAEVGEDRFTISDLEVGVPSDSGPTDAANLSATIRGQAVSRDALMAVVEAFEHDGLFTTVRLVRFRDSTGEYELRLMIDHAASEEP